MADTMHQKLIAAQQSGALIALTLRASGRDEIMRGTVLMLATEYGSRYAVKVIFKREGDMMPWAIGEALIEQLEIEP